MLSRVVAGGFLGLHPASVKIHRTPLGRPFLAHREHLELNASHVPAHVALAGHIAREGTTTVDVVRTGGEPTRALLASHLATDGADRRPTVIDGFRRFPTALAPHPEQS